MVKSAVGILQIRDTTFFCYLKEMFYLQTCDTNPIPGPPPVPAGKHPGTFGSFHISSYSPGVVSYHPSEVKRPTGTFFLPLKNNYQYVLYILFNNKNERQKEKNIPARPSGCFSKSPCEQDTLFHLMVAWSPCDNKK